VIKKGKDFYETSGISLGYVMIDVISGLPEHDPVNHPGDSASHREGSPLVGASHLIALKVSYGAY